MSKYLHYKTLKLFRAEDEKGFLTAYAKRFCRDSNDVFFKELNAINNGETSFESPVHVFSLDGKRHQIALKWVVPEAYKDTYQKVLVTLIDTSLQRSMEELMHIKNHAIESSKSGIIITDLEGKITYANNAFLSLWRLPTNKSILGQTVQKYLPTPEGALKVLQTVHVKKEWSGDLFIEHPDGSIAYFDGQGKFVLDEYKEPLGMVFSFIDITEHKQTEKIRLEFTNIAAHELKTPITPLKTFLTMMIEDPKKFGLNAEGMKFLDVCMRNVKRLNVLIGDILDISRLEAQGMKFTMGQVDLLSIIKQRTQDFSVLAKEKRLVLKDILPAELPQIYGDEERLGQVVGALLKNAVNFTDRGSITVKAEVKDDVVHVHIIDTGSGIRKEDIGKLFTKFFQAEDISTRKTKGSGLGLAIAKGIITAHNGRIWAESAGKGKGSIFSFSLPIKKGKILETKKVQEKPSKALSTLDEKALMDVGKKKAIRTASRSGLSGAESIKAPVVSKGKVPPKKTKEELLKLGEEMVKSFKKRVKNEN